MITKDDIATYRANYNLDDFGVAGSLGFPTKGACAAINALCDAYEEIEKQRDELLAACEKTISENGHLADGDVCTLIDFKRAIARVKADRRLVSKDGALR